MRIKTATYKAIAAGVRVLWNAFSLCGKRKKKTRIAFLSRQYDRPFDFVILEPELKKRFPEYEIVWSCKREGWKINPIQTVRHIRLAATSRICIADCYIPGISIPTRHDGALYMQIWHAIGAIKKFGYQSVGTKQGRSSEMANALSMHRGYDAVIAGLPGFTSDMSEAFCIDAAKIYAVGTPRVDFFVGDSFASLRAERARRFKERNNIDWSSSDDFVILYVPTFRRIRQNSLDGFVEKVNRLIDGLVEACDKRPSFRLIVSLHSKQEYTDTISAGVPQGPSNVNVTMIEANSIDAMLVSNAVITDYSAISFEAALLGKPVYFLAADYEDYRKAPGLNIDPFEEFPSISFDDPVRVVDRIEEDLRKPGNYEKSGFTSFMANYRGDVGSGSIARVCDVIESNLR